MSEVNLQIIGAGLPRTATASLSIALEQLLGGPVCHMRSIPGHLFALGPAWEQALAGRMPNWDQLYAGHVAALDWPTSMFWRELSEAYPEALVLLSLRDTAVTWWQSANETILPVARLALDPNWQEGRGLLDLLERFAGSRQWDDPAILQAAYERHSAAVRQGVPQHRLLEWQPTEGWEPICNALGLPVPERPFPWTNRRDEWRQ
jgi:hypothetical protein